MITITKEFKFSAAHTIIGHPKCGRLHGHNYRVLVTLGAEVLNDFSMVLDFSELSDIVRRNVIEPLDHRYIVSHANRADNDPYVKAARSADELVYLPVNQSTAECIATCIGELINSLLARTPRENSPRCLEVTVWETDTGSATWRSVEQRQVFDQGGQLRWEAQR